MKITRTKKVVEDLSQSHVIDGAKSIRDVIDPKCGQVESVLRYLTAEKLDPVSVSFRVEGGRVTIALESKREVMESVVEEVPDEVPVTSTEKMS